MSEAPSWRLDLTGAAELLGMSYDYLQRSWRTLAATEGFPRPYLGERKNESPRWLRSSIVGWMEDRSRGAPSGIVRVEQPEPIQSPAEADPAEAILAVLCRVRPLEGGSPDGRREVG